MTTASKERVKSGLVPLSEITPRDLIEMHALFIQYYDNVPLEIFIRDLNKKQAVILVRGRKSNLIRGFSTITEVPLTFKGKKAIGVFSGDTVMHKEFWGGTTLHKPFFAYMLKLRFSKPFTPVFWLLISKGYKTYLLMANNFDCYYPRYDKPDQPDYEALVETYCETLWPGKYSKETRLLHFGENTQRLKDHVTPITNKLRREVPKIAFFEERNPTWMHGTELPCLGEAKFSSAFVYGKKFVGKILGAKKSSARVPQTASQVGS